MPVTTVSAAAHITPVAVKTLYKHYRTKGKKFKDGNKEEVALDDIFFDEGFHIVKSFIELGTQNTIESLQAFTNTHVPAPPWAAVVPVQVPFASCNAAADLLINWFDPSELKHVVGGEKWWQVRGLDGIDAEWIAEKEFLSDSQVAAQPGSKKKKRNQSEETLSRMEHLESVMLYVHGGAYFWGSINSHRYQIIRYARKFQGRAFAVNYRKAPQYPWPCPLHDVLAAYLYLTNPPQGASHTPVSPSKLVLAGDSAGGGLCLAALAVLRDMGIQLPAGAVLISPWIDLTHSFPSVMANTKSDIIPPHGFIAKPSASWPIDLKRDRRVSITVTMPPPVPGHADKLNPDIGRVVESIRQQTEWSPPNCSEEAEKIPSQAEMFAQINSEEHCDLPFPGNSKEADSRTASRRYESSALEVEFSEEVMEVLVDRFQPKPPKVLMENPDDTPLELRSQIHFYATTEQLTHPLVSPILQGSLGNLCPLYILAGDGEVLRDEIIYVAHKAAHPDQYPTRVGILKETKRQKENTQKFTTPTKVHLQVFDGMCHVLTVFSYTDSAKYAYRSIAQFVKHVTQNSTAEVARRAFPESAEGTVADSDSEDPEAVRKRRSIRKKKNQSENAKHERNGKRTGSNASEGPDLYEENTQIITREFEKEKEDRTPGRVSKAEDLLGVDVHEAGNVVMIRERVDIHGKVRPMEPRDQIPALQIPPEQVGLIKEAPVRRWLAGQEMWDKRYAQTTDKVAKKRRKIEAKSASLVASAREQGLVLAHELGGDHREQHRLPRADSSIPGTPSRIGFIDSERRWGPLDLDDESPPPTAIAKRRDTPEALALLRKMIYHTAPVTHNMVPERLPADVIRAAFDPEDHPLNAPRQSVSEQQMRARIVPIHGMRIWDTIVGYFMRKKAMAETNRVVPTSKCE